MPAPIVLAPLFAGLSALFSRLVFTQGGRWVVALMAYFGIAFATHQAVVGPATDYAAEAFAGLPGDIADWIGYLKVDQYASMVLSAYFVGAVKNVILRKLSA